MRSLPLKASLICFGADIDAIIVPSRIGTRAWYKDRALLYQVDNEGRSVPIQTGIGAPLYEIEDATQQLVSFAYVREETLNNVQGVTLLVAKNTTENERGLIHLTDDELNAYISNFWNRIRLFGVRLSVQSPVADAVGISELHIVYEATILAADGTLLRDPSISPIRQAIIDYFSSIDEDNGFTMINFLCAIQAAEGFRSFRTHGSGRFDVDIALGAISNILGNDVRDPIFPSAGYYTISPETLTNIDYELP